MRNTTEELRITTPTERRKDLKLPLKEEIVVYKDNRHSFSAVTRDLSAGGVYFNANTLLEEEEEITIEIKIDGEPMRIKAKVLRVESSSAKGYGFGYGCRFEFERKEDGMIQKIRKIRKLVYGIQLRKRKMID